MTIDLNLASNGLVRLVSCQNRSKYIGQEGLHATEAIWKKWGFKDIDLKDYPTEIRLKEFNLLT